MATHTTDGSLADVQAKIDSAAIGDTVQIPSGSFTWGTSGAYLEVDRPITLEGAGTGSTTITISDDAGTFTSATLRIGAAAVVKDFSITGSSSSADNTTPISCGTVDGWRISNISYTQPSGHKSYFAYIGGSYGLISSCDITAGDSSELIFIRGKSDSWQTDVNWGSDEAVYIEDCTFSGSSGAYVCDINDNGRAVIRFNTIESVIKIDLHGAWSNSTRGGRSVEAYGNRWTNTSGFGFNIEIRGGTGFVWDNQKEITSNLEGTLEYKDYFYTSNVVGTGGNSIGKYGTPNDYPMNDQIGVGKDPKSAASEPLYSFLNRRDGGSEFWTRKINSPSANALSTYQTEEGDGGATFDGSDIIQADRDIFEEIDGTFDGTSGIGTGTRSEMDAITPSLTGVGFWVTDEGTWNTGSGDGRLYTWSGSAWVLKYEPYTYPHPLTTASLPTSQMTNPPNTQATQAALDSIKADCDTLNALGVGTSTITASDLSSQDYEAAFAIQKTNQDNLNTDNALGLTLTALPGTFEGNMTALYNNLVAIEAALA